MLCTFAGGALRRKGDDTKFTSLLVKLAMRPGEGDVCFGVPLLGDPFSIGGVLRPLPLSSESIMAPVIILTVII